jgi:NADH dehydrogenase/NADH:ubiquinone oxidoreductase subunit G
MHSLSRCVRFATEVAGVEVLGTTSRGETTEIGTYIGKVFNSELSGNVIDLCPVGALTSKPYAFTARPWELQSVESIDLSDGLGRNTRLDTRGSDLLRVLPRLNEEINEEWLADKARFRHDGLTQQRLVAPVFKKDGFFHQVSFSEARLKFKNLFQQAILSEQQGSLGLFLGETSDAQTLMAAQGLSDIIPDRFVESRHSHLRGSVKKRIISADLPNNFGFNSSLDALENSDLCILVGVNPRREGTLINTRLRKGVLKGNISVANFGPSMDLTYPVQHLGTSLSSFLNFVEGKHSFSKMLSVAQNPVILLGTGPLYSDEGQFFIQGCQRLSDRFKNLSLNILHSKANEVTALTVGSVSEDTRVKCALGIAIEKDRLPENTASQWVYIGSHIRDEILNHPGLQLCLPASRFAEKSGMFLSLTKSIQETTKAVPSPEEAQSRSLILENLIFLLEDLGYAGLSNLRKTSDHQLNLENSFCLERRSRNIQDVQMPLVLNQLIPTLDEEEIFFQSNIICRNSPTLSVCAQSKTWSNF